MVALTVIGIILIGGLFLFLYLRHKAKKFLSQLTGSSDLSQITNNLNLSELISQQENDEQDTPKSLNGMDSVYLSIISRDFPELNIEEFRLKSEQMLISALNSITNQNTDMLLNSSDDLKTKIQQIINNNKSINREEYYKDIQVYKTVLSQYVKSNGICKIVLQCAVSYNYYIKQNDTIISGSETETQQERYAIEMIYVQDASKINATKTSSFSTTCPNCGAPITSLGQKVCSYCNSAIEAININVWRINNFYKQ